MINGVNPNGDILQAEAKASIGIPVSNKFNGTNYAGMLNRRAKDRMAAYRKSMRRMDELQAVNRFKWHSLPIGLRSALVERILYFRGQGMFFFDKTLDRYLFLPYSLTSENDSSIDMYGQYTLVKPMTFNGKAENKPQKNVKPSTQEVYIGLITKTPVYDLEELKQYLEVKGLEWCQENLCIIIRDYTNQLSENIEPLSIMQEAWIGSQAEIPLFFRTSLLQALAPDLIRVADQGTMDVVLAELQAVEDAILEGKTRIPVTALQEIQELTGNKNVDRLIESILKSYDAMDTIRQTHLGVTTNGAFQKQSGMGQGEASQTEGRPNLIIADGLNNRQEGADMIRTLFPDLKTYVDEGEGLDEHHEEKDEAEEAEKMKEVDEGDNIAISN